MVMEEIITVRDLHVSENELEAKHLQSGFNSYAKIANNKEYQSLKNRYDKFNDLPPGKSHSNFLMIV